MALGSVTEVQTQLLIAKYVGYMQEKHLQVLQNCL